MTAEIPYHDLPFVLTSPPEDILFEEGEIKNRRGEKIHWSSWQRKEGANREDDPRYLIVLQHGYAEHNGRYHRVASYLARAGFTIFSAESYGHGQTHGHRGHIQKWNYYTDDLEEAIYFAKQRFRPAHTFLLGHSNGGLIALRHALLHPGSIEAYAVSSPFVGFAKPINGLLRTSVTYLSKWIPKFPIPMGDLAHLVSHNASIVDAYRNDPYVFSKTTARWAIETIKAQEELMQRAKEINAPFLFFVSEEDGFVDPEKTKQLYEKIASKQKELHLLPGLYHENLNEEGWHERLNHIAHWLHTFHT